LSMRLKVNEIFHSIQGETTRAGFPSVLIRLTGCNLRCRYCDTAYAWAEGGDLSIDEIISMVKKYGAVDHITVTGGEPLLQANSIHLMKGLLEFGYDIQLETNGSMSTRDVPPLIRKIIDVKTPSSGEVNSFLFENLDYLHSGDELKFVLSDRADYNYSKEFLKKYLEKRDIVINFSPVFNRMSFGELADLILHDGLMVRLNIQLHRLVWPEGEPKERGEV
jgi:7-carboxy-7-deazaguanine synthase